MLLVLLLVTCAYGIQAQTIKGIVKDAEGKSLSNATVQLLKDTSVSKFAVTDNEGNFSFTNIQSGKYTVRTSYVGFTSASSATFQLDSNDVNLPVLVLLKPVSQLGDVTVTAKRPMVEVKADKTILNVEGTINATGQDALELLRKAPGVLVDKDDNLSVSGKNGVQVYIDGRLSPLSGKDLSDYLKTLQSSQVEAIEIITNPSAKFDAAGNAGIINIKLKKNKSFGTNGSVNAGYNIGTYSKYNGGIALNHRNKKINLFGNYNYNRSLNANFMNMHREIKDTLFETSNNMTSRNNSHGFKAGMDFFINNKNTIGLMVNGNIGDNAFANYGTTNISYMPTKIVDRLLIADNSSTVNRDNVNLNVNYRYAEGSKRELNIDGDYGSYGMNSNQMQPNYYFSPAGSPIDSVIYNMIAPTNIDIYTFKTDYEQDAMKGKLGIGGKIAYIKTDNDFQRFDVYNSDRVKDSSRSNRFAYEENVNALYANYNRTFKSGVMIQLGVRVENANAEGRSDGFKQNGTGGYTKYDSSFTRNYTDVFPSAAITFNKNPMKQWSFSYSRRIDRPAYQDLNPFEFKLDEYNYQKGNTRLTPQYTNSFGVTYVYKYMLTTRLNYSHVNDVFGQLIDTIEKSKNFITKDNLAQQDIVSLNISTPFSYKWFSTFININSYYSHYQADLRSGKIDLDIFAASVFSQNTLKLGKTLTGEISGYYNSPSIWQGTFKNKAMWGIDAGLQKTIFKGKGTIKASVTDIFKTMRWSGTTDFAGQYLKVSGGWESRQLRLNFSYRFGNSQVKAARQRKTASEDENKRAGSSGGGLGQ